jgi:16S rRNA (guanine527-N7)-methyltransferase
VTQDAGQGTARAKVQVRLARQPTPVRATAEALFGDRLPAAERYAVLLVTDGVVRGLIGPREAPRIWERHLLNCAAVAELVPPGTTVIDVGSGAGLPGIVLAVARPDLTITLLEPMLRRVTFLVEVVEALDLAGRVSVERGRAEEVAGRLPEADVATARALAPLDRLAAWCLPLVSPGGRVLALKGTSAEDEVAAHAAAVRRLGGGTPAIHHCGVGQVDPPAIVVEIERM